MRGAQLRALTGGKSKWDLKRSFGIIESSGKTRFVVAESEDEYNSWIREVQRAIQYQELFVADENDEVNEDETTNNADNDSIEKVTSDRDEESVGVASSGPAATDSVQAEQAKSFRGKLAGIGSLVKRSNKDASSPRNDRGSQQPVSGDETPAAEADPEAAEGDLDTAEGQPGSQGVRGKLAGIGSFIKRGKKQDQSSPRPGNEGESQPDASVEETISSATTDLTEDQMAAYSTPNKGDSSDSKEPSPTNLGTKSTPQDGQSAGKGRRLVGKIAGVGQATGRWGSALVSATRQKGREVADRTRRAATPNSKADELSSSGHNTLPLHVISEREDEERSWACPTCTFLNTTSEADVDILICAVCDSPTEPGNVVFQDKASETVNIEASSSPEAKLDTEMEPSRDRLGSTDSGQELFRRQASEPVGFRSRASSADSDTDNFRRTQSAENFATYVDEDETSIISDLAMDETGEAGRPGGRRRSRLGGLLGSGRKGRPARPAESPAESKGWFSRLGSNVSGQDEADDFQKAAPALKLKNIRLNPNVDVVCENPPAVSLPLQKLVGSWYVHVTPCEPSRAAAAANIGRSTSADSAASPEPQRGSEESLLSAPLESNEHHFFVRIFQKGNSFELSNSSVIKSFSDIVGFHTIISECVVDLIHHPMFYEKSYQRTANGEMSNGLKNALGVSLLDSVRISGAFLAGLVDAMSSNPQLGVPPARHGKLSR